MSGTVLASAFHNGSLGRARRAYTLLELIVVLTVAAALLVLAVPLMVALRDASAIRSAMSELGASFGLARQSAIAGRVTVAVVFDTSSGVVIVRSAGQTLVRRALGATYGVQLRSDRDSAGSDPRGLGSGLSNLSVTVSRGSFIDTLTMSRLGRVRW
ncbi:MAG TPA: prepilin-type N-terminal cleavage/methylation domain-containing protein [Gemmatimonadaceae bacterium]|nr:prepilin-type N-terminal cleavage/methylation domain-containing protein [Gemmatimonadaceae bacterium]